MLPSIRKTVLFGLWCFVFAQFAHPASARQDSVEDSAGGDLSPVRLARLSGDIVVDGRVDEAAWDEIEPFPIVVHGPSYGTVPSENTEMRVAYDEEYLYFSCRCFDSEPDGIQATSYKRDGWNSAFDQVGIVLDTFNDNENGLIFVVSSVGVRIDVAIFNDGNATADDFPLNMSWDTFWDAETTKTDEGWFSEIRIPLSSLKFDSRDGMTSMGLIAYRYMSRSRETQIFPDIRPDWGFLSFLKPSKARDVELTGIQAKKPLYITPYVLGGMSQTWDLNEGETEYVRDDDPTYDVGLDLKYGLSNNLTLDLSVNTDFAQVEADDQQVNLTRFSLFFPEKRRFFQERTSNFDFNFGGFNQLFYSRRIGLDKEEDEERIPLLGGVRLVGRIGKWDVGFLNMQSARHLDFASENYGVLRLRRQVINPNTYVGGIVTSRVDEDGIYNIGLGADGIFRVFGDDYFTANWAQTFETDGESGLDASRFRALWEKRRYRGLSYLLTVARAGKDYNPGLGFEQREDFFQLSEQFGYGWIPSEFSPLAQHQLTVLSNWYLRNSDRETDTFQMRADWGGFWKSGYMGFLIFQRSFEALDEEFELSDDAVVPVGEYTYADIGLILQSPETHKVWAMSTLNAGSFYDGRRFSAMLQPTWNASRYFNLTGTYQYDKVDFDDRDQSFTSHIARLRAELTLNRTFSVSSFVQFDSSEDISIANFRLRFNPREGNDFYLVYNEGFNTNRLDRIPELPLSDGRTILLKYSYTFLR